MCRLTSSNHRTQPDDTLLSAVVITTASILPSRHVRIVTLADVVTARRRRFRYDHRLTSRTASTMRVYVADSSRSGRGTRSPCQNFFRTGYFKMGGILTKEKFVLS